MLRRLSLLLVISACDPVVPPASAPPPAVQQRLEPRAGDAPATLRTVSLQGREVALGQGAFEGLVDGAPRPFTLEHTKVDIAVSGFMQEVTVTQRFKNAFSTPVEAVYVFPLPEDAAVHAMKLVAGPRTLEARIAKRFEARQAYEQAKAEGRRAALLDQERPNIFTQSVANLLPGETVLVTLSYVAPLKFDDGVYTLNFPMVVGPRYVPGAPLPGASEGTGIAPDTDVVSDASRITPPAVRDGRDVEISVRLDAGTVIEDLWSVSHRLVLDRPSSRLARLSLEASDTVPNKDLIVRWRVSGPESRAAVLASGGAFAVMLAPQLRQAPAPRTPKELVFLIDTSCSMNGAPLAAAKNAMRLALEQLHPDDTFMLIDFAENARVFNEAPLPATGEHLGRAWAHLSSLPAAGGTNQLAGIRKALSREEDPKRLRMVLLMTDGFIGNEDQIFAETARLRGNARVFGFGIGTSVNHHLLARLSDEGRGFYQYVRPDENATEAVTRFARRIERPLLTDLQLEWQGLDVVDVLPSAVPDLFDAQPLLVQGRYRAAGVGTLLIRARRGGEPVTLEVPVTLPDPSTPGRALSMAWARKRIEQLSMELTREEKPALVEQITTLGLEHHLVTKYTSLVAVDEQKVTDQASTTVTEPTLQPDLQARVAARGLLKIVGGSNGGSGAFDGLGLSGTGAGGSGIGVPMNGAFGRGDAVGAGFGSGSSTLGAPLLWAGGLGTKGGGAVDLGAKAKQAAPLTIGPAEVQGGVLGPETLRALLARHRTMFQYCVEREQLKTPGLTGRLVFSWHVEADGTLSHLELVTKEHETLALTGCMASALRKVRFPAHGGPTVVVKVPFTF